MTGRERDTFFSFIPIDRRQALAHGTILGDRATGAVLFADISGFTRLTSSLYQELGPQRGAEELDRRLNQVFDAIIDRIHQYRGSVVTFSGDAVTCWFDGDNGLWATACALEIQEVMASVGPVALSTDSSLPVSIKAAVAAGSLRRFIVGDESIQLVDTLAGALLERVATAESLATRGEVIVCATVAQLLGDQLRAAEQRRAESGETYFVVESLETAVTGRPWLNPPQSYLDQNKLRPWLLPPVYDRLSSGQDQFLAELRHSVALFMHFDGLDYDGDPQAGRKLDQFVRHVQEIVFHYGGSLINLTIGDKGSYLLCSFGAPVAYEDDARRAASATLDLLDLPQVIHGIDSVRIGISQGIMFSGAYGGKQRRTYSILGEETNVAARLMGQAKPGQAIVTERIASTTNLSHRYQELPAVSVKGIAEPIPVFGLMARRQAAGRSARKTQSEMVGRNEERDLLQRRLLALQNDGVGGVTIIEGEAGIGKSRLLEDLMHQAARQGQATYLGAADAIEKNATYHAWRSVFWDLFELDSAADAEPPGAGRLSPGQRQLILDHMQTAAPDKQHLAPLLNAVLPTDLPDNELTAQMAGEVRAGNTQELLVALLNGKAEQKPLLIIVEDAHWLDSASWALARNLSRDVSALLLVIATRPLSDPLPAEYSALLDRANTQRLVLSTLPPDETLQLVRLRLGIEVLPDAVQELLLEKAGGHPFFSEELAYALRDTGLLVIDDGAGKLSASEAELAALTFPDSIDSVITSRIDLLTPQQQLTLKVASVIGRVFPYRALCDIHPVAADRAQLQDQLNTLERLDITPLETPEPDLSYIFKHIITQEVAYNLMSFAQRQGLHQANAEWLETTYSDDLGPYYPLIAYHYQQALGDDYDRTDLGEKALAYLEQAAVQALGSFANREAVGYFESLLALNEALGYPAPTVTHARWIRGLGEAIFRLGNWKESIQYFEEAVALLGYPLPKSSFMLGSGLAGQSLAQAISFVRSPETNVGTSQPYSVNQELLLEATGAYRSLVQAYFYLEERYLFIYTGLTHANLAHELGHPSELLTAYANLGLTAGNVPLHRLARAYCRRVTHIGETVDNLQAKTWAYVITGFYYLYVGSWLDSGTLLQQGAEMATELGYRRSWEEATLLLGIGLLDRGRLNEALPKFASVAYSAERRGDAQTQIWGICGQAEVRIWKDDDLTASLDNLLEATRLLATGNVGVNDQIRVHGTAAVIYLRMGDDRLALEEAQKVLDLIPQAGLFIPYARPGYHGALDVLLSLWEKAEDQTAQEKLASSAREALKPVRQMGRTFPVIAPRAWLQQGRYDWLSGNHSKAQKAWRKSMALAQELSMPTEEAVARYEYGSRLPPNDPERDAHLVCALELLSAAGASYLVKLIRTELTGDGNLALRQ